MTIDEYSQKYLNPYWGPRENDAKAELQKLMAAERLDELKHLNPNDDDSWLEDVEQYERDGSSPIKYVDERIAELKAKVSGE